MSCKSHVHIIIVVCGQPVGFRPPLVTYTPYEISRRAQHDNYVPVKVDSFASSVIARQGMHCM
jgi:hypothetical protein